MEWMNVFEEYFSAFVKMTIHTLEFMGVIILIIGAVKAFVGYFTHKEANIRLQLAQAMALALEFKLGGEILRTVVARDWNEILIVCAIIAMRAALNFLIHWEISHIQHDSIGK